MVYIEGVEGLSRVEEDAMRTKVTELGMLLEQLFEGVDEVEIRQEHNMVVVVPITHSDPILELGEHPVTVDIDDASTNHDHYLYPS